MGFLILGGKEDEVKIGCLVGDGILGSFWLTFLLVGGVLVKFVGFLFSASNNCFNVLVWWCFWFWFKYKTGSVNPFQEI